MNNLASNVYLKTIGAKFRQGAGQMLLLLKQSGINEYEIKRNGKGVSIEISDRDAEVFAEFLQNQNKKQGKKNNSDSEILREILDVLKRIEAIWQPNPIERKVA